MALFIGLIGKSDAPGTIKKICCFSTRSLLSLCECLTRQKAIFMSCSFLAVATCPSGSFAQISPF
jgi:hypothetical protein